MAGDNLSIPSHVGVIMDGNGRWATARGKNRSFGHKAGSNNVDRIVTHAFTRGVKTVTLYAFSSENWSRPKAEVDELMRLLKAYLKKFTKKLVKNEIRLFVMGDVNGLPAELRQIISDSMATTEKFKEKALVLGINYGGRGEIVRAVNKLISDGKEITEQSILNNLDTAEFGEPDLIIRTGGEVRLSNFMLYQGAYSELYFTDVLWPDFDEAQIDLALKNFSERTRRFGKI